MDLDEIQAICHQPQGHYDPPHQRNAVPIQARQEQNKPSFSVEKATLHRGQPLNADLKMRCGNQCHYCKQEGHWCNNCAQFWSDVNNNIINTSPIPEFHNGKILIDSGASTHMSGSLKMFISKQELMQPKTIILAVADCSVTVRFKGTISILISKDLLMIDDVFYCLGVNGVIISVGRLTKAGWTLNCQRNRQSQFQSFTIKPSSVLLLPAIVEFFSSYTNS
ncbi:uncharacterized protein VP01_2110g1 [Puccinia sorghi]|uniref:Retrovirus-related Pol polyprotein from transposon TNT 1-94-like beta-barrel domain-containing protein n=1 Tax=Puccinia sorghi TaxID=27349 RepID=A0A0L6VA79_9BASI|nr:uncharacterized protein VP01_2110g1 [Puccinia sorghi]